MPLLSRRDPFDDPAWLYELKLDGFRALAFVDPGRCGPVSRNGHVFKSWPTLCTAIATTIGARTAVLDGEVVCLDDDGRPNFRALLFRRTEPVFYAFDLLMFDGRDLRERRLVERKRMLRRVTPRRADRLRYLEHVNARGVALFQAVCEQDVEGIVAKRRDGVYDPKATTWIKVKNRDYTDARNRWELFERRAMDARR